MTFKNYKYLGKTVQILLVFLCLYLLISQTNLRLEAIVIPVIATSDIIYILVISLSLSLVNWTLESKRWVQVNKPSILLSTSDAFRQNLKAHSAALFSPLKLGEYPVKLAEFQPKYRKRVARNILFNNNIQLFTTLFFGLPALLLLSLELKTSYKKELEISSIALLIGLAIYIAFNKKLIPPFWKSSLFLSVCRYLTFSSAYIICIYILQPEVHIYTLIIGVYASYLLSSLVSIYSLFDLVFKTSVFLLVLNSFGVNPEIVLFISLISWVFNAAVPALFGLALFIPNKR